jgi:hypothetical protein
MREAAWDLEARLSVSDCCRVSGSCAPRRRVIGFGATAPDLRPEVGSGYLS